MKHKNINCLSHLSFFVIAVFVLALSMQASAGIVGQWLLNETSGTVAKDTSGNGNDGEIIGKANWANGKFGKALELDGTSTGLKVAPGLELKNFTAVLWVNSGKDWGETRTELWCGSQTYGDAVLIRGDERADWKPGEAMLHWTDGAAWHAIGSGKLKSKTWYHLAGTFDGKTLKFYKNGKLAGEKDSKIGAGAKDTFIGCHPNPTNYFQGMIDDVAVFDDALSREDIEKIVNRGLENWLPVEASGKNATHWARIKNSAKTK
jgi:hypothetical protein